MSTPYITVTGHLGKDPDIKTGASGKPYEIGRAHV